MARAARMTVAMRPPRATWVFDTVTPAATSAITSPASSSTGTTARTDGPSVPVYVSVKASPARARSMLPRNFWPIRAGSRCVYRVRSGAMIVTKSTPASVRTTTAYGCIRADGSPVPSAVRTNGSDASVSATAMLFAAASRSTSARASAQIHTTAIVASATIMTSCRTKSFVAMLQPRIHRVIVSPRSVAAFSLGSVASVRCEHYEHNASAGHPPSHACPIPTPSSTGPHRRPAMNRHGRQTAMALQSRTPGTKSRRRIDSSHYLYIAVIGAVLAGITVGLAAPEFAVGLKPIGDAFVLLIKMMIAPIIFCTIVLGVGSIAKAATVGKVGGLALLYFIVMSTFALGIGLVVGNLIHPGEGLDISGATYDAGTTEAKTTQEFVLGIIPTSLLSALVDGNILQVLFVALLVGFALQKMGPKGTPILGAIRQIQGLVFRILAMIMWIAPIGAFGAIAAVVGATGVGAI